VIKPKQFLESGAITLSKAIDQERICNWNGHHFEAYNVIVNPISINPAKKLSCSILLETVGLTAIKTIIDYGNSTT